MVYSLENGYTKGELKVIGWVHDLAFSQGFYGRLEEQLKEDRDLLRFLGNQNFKSIWYIHNIISLNYIIQYFL